MKILRIFIKSIGVLIGLLLLLSISYYGFRCLQKNRNLELLGPSVKLLVENGQKYRDLNKNGKCDVYENTKASIKDRLDDLISQMTLEEKAGTMFITIVGIHSNGDPYDLPFIPSNAIDLMINVFSPTSSDMIARRKMNSFNIVQSYDADVMARFNNQIQEMAERTRLGIPVTIASDPRHGTENNPGAALFTPCFSQWPSFLGFAATRDTQLVKEFANIARQEYRSIGITLALHPMADLATEPRWARSNGTFGEDANLSSMMTKAYILGFQSDSLDSEGVACMTKHFSGGGPQKNGEDAHFPYGKEQVYPGNNFNYHLQPFIHGALAVNTAQIMPYYGIPVDQSDENVAFGFNKEIINGILRDSLGFDGVVCTDWNIISKGRIAEERAWGVEHLSPKLRAKKALDAGCDQFGGESSPELIIQLFHDSLISEKRINKSVRRILKDKFRLGLFDNPYVDEKSALQIAGNEQFRRKGKIAQAKSTVLLKNDNLLPLQPDIKIYCKGFSNPELLESYAETVNNPSSADVVLLRLNTPYEPRSKNLLERFFHQGRLYYTDEEKKEIFKLIANKAAVVIVNLERAAILTEVAQASNALLVEFGTSDEVLISLLFGKHNPSAKLPFELPSSWEAVLNQLEDVPYDSENPLYPFGFGLSYH